MPASLTAAAPGIIGLGLNKRLLLFFLIWPGFNYGSIIAIMHATHTLNASIAFDIALRTWTIFTVFFLLIAILEHTIGRKIRRRYFWLNLLSHTLLIVLAFFIVRATMGLILEKPAPLVFWIAPLFLSMEVTIYIIAIHLVMQRDRTLHLMLNLKQAEIETLRSQSNPHFLFNTLNLIASETIRAPHKAKDLIYDLSDLLRKTINLTQTFYIPVAEELEVVELYLRLQQKRFEDRLNYRITCTEECKTLAIPPLLLQPVIENAIKYAVAPYACEAKIEVEIQCIGGKLVIHVRDTGPGFSEHDLQEGTGLSILRKTLRNYYPHGHYLALKSTSKGGHIHITLPAKEYIMGRQL